MTYKEYSEKAEIVYSLTVTVNDNEAITVTGYDETSLLGELRKVDNVIAAELQEQYEDLAEPEESEV